MTSRKYILQPITPATLPSHYHNRGQSTLGINTPTYSYELKKRDSLSLPLPFSPFTYYDHKDYDTKHTPQNKTVECDSKEQPPAPPELETDLKKFRDYKKNESKFARSTSNVFVHPFQYISAVEDVLEREKAPDGNFGDFAAWIREMNSKLVTKKRQIRMEKKRAERSNKEQSPRSSTTKKAKSNDRKNSSNNNNNNNTLFQLGRKKKSKKEDEYDTIEHGRKPRRVMTAHDLSTKTIDEGVKLSRVYSHQYHKAHQQSDHPLFQHVRGRAFSITEDETNPPTTRPSPTTPPPHHSKSKAFSFKNRSATAPTSPNATTASFFAAISSSTPKHHSDHDIRALRRLARNVVAVGLAT